MPDGALNVPQWVRLRAREQIALFEFERRRAELLAASLRLIDATVELRDARDAVQAE